MVCARQRLDYDEEMSSPLPDHSVPVTGAGPVTRVLITGAHGQLGAAMVQAFEGLEVIAHTRADAGRDRRGAVDEAVHAARPQLIVNCAAFNDVDGAEDRATEALAVNAFAVRSLARAAEEAGARFVHYSTDFVFDGAATTPYTRGRAAIARARTYAASKLLGEWFALEAPQCVRAPRREPLRLAADWTGRRGTLDGIVAASSRVARSGCSPIGSCRPATSSISRRRRGTWSMSGAAPGLYHCVNSGHATWYDVAREVARLHRKRAAELRP